MNDSFVLLLEQEQATVEQLSGLAKEAGFEVQVAGSLRDVDQQEGDPAIVFACCDDEPDSLIQLLAMEKVKQANEVVVIGSHEHSEDLREHIGRAAVMFLAKPLDADFVTEILGDVKAEVRRAGVGESPDATVGTPLDQCGLLRGSARPMRRLYRLIRKVAPTHAAVLVTGESGTGKELVAQTIHMSSSVSEGPFLAINCGAIPGELIESELFGHERGSFSGAERMHRGVFERASGGTLFLDEITEMPASAQVKLLRVLETGRFQRVGGEKDVNASVRIVAASNRDPNEAIDSGVLRHDLYYRIAQFALWLPPLKDRGSDIIGLSRVFLHELNEQNKTDAVLTEEVEQALMEYSWPGNVRELRSVIERAYIVGNSEITLAELPPLHDEGNPIEQGEYLRVSVGSSLDDSERRLIFATLDANHGDKKRTAQVLGISLKTLYNRLNRYAEEADDSTSESAK